MLRLGRLAALAGGLLVAGCVEQTLTVTSDPPGAVVTLNDQELGRTPLTREFTWYGNYDVIMRAEGFETLKTSRELDAPWHSNPPFDLFAEMLPWKVSVHRDWHFKMNPQATQPSSPELLARADETRGELRSSEFTRTATKPTTSTTQKKPRPAATMPGGMK